jgi:hypothetical protein
VGDKNLFVKSQQQQSMGIANVYPTRFMKEFNKYEVYTLEDLKWDKTH